MSPSLPFFVFLSLAGGTLQQPFEALSRYITRPYNVMANLSWPTASTWATLNDTLGGRLQALRPWAAVCYVDDPLYDPVQCQTVLDNYTNDTARENVPSALLWANWESCGFNNSCALNYSNPQPVSGATCYQGTTPSYSIVISSAEDASGIVKWATPNNVRLTIKNTGHDYLGRSSRPDTLQVFTHYLKEVVYVANFVPQGSSAAPVPAVTIGAGAQLEETEHNASAVLGGCLTVGAAGGFIQGGGHSILSPAYGLAVDNLLEVEIVTADGVIRTINAVQDSDLFWAVSGGGAGSWGLVISITVAALPPTKISVSSLTIEPNATQDLQTLGVDFIALLGKYQNQLVNSGITSFTAFIAGTYSLAFLWPAEQVSVSMLYPLFDEIRALSSNYSVLSNTTQESMYSSVSAAILEDVGPAMDSIHFYGGSMEIASRFVPQSMLESPENIRSVAEAIWEGIQIVTAPKEGNPDGVFNLGINAALFGDMPAATKQRVNDTGANSGFYDAAWHVAYAGAWTVGTNQSTYRSLTQAVYNAVGPLTALGLTGSYQNEGSVWETNWEEAFFSYKYDQLLQTKQKYDPNNFFTTYKGVGSDLNLGLYSCYQSDALDP